MNTVRTRIAVAIFAASSLTAGCMSSSTTTPPPVQAGMVVTVFYSSVHVGGVIAGDQSPINDGDHVITNETGQLQFAVQSTLTCDQFHNTDVIAVPSSIIMVKWVNGSATCWKNSGPPRTLGAAHVLIHMTDPVFTIVRGPHQTTVRVAYGSVTVKTTDVPGTAYVPMYHQVMIVDGHPPGPVTPYDFGTLPPFEQRAIRSFLAQVSPSTSVTPPAQTSPASPLAQTISFIGKAPTYAKPGAKYTVMATGGGSGNPVVFSTENSVICSASTTVNSNQGYSATVSFIHRGNCVIDASQDGNAQYKPALAQLSVTVL